MSVLVLGDKVIQEKNVCPSSWQEKEQRLILLFNWTTSYPVVVGLLYHICFGKAFIVNNGEQW